MLKILVVCFSLIAILQNPLVLAAGNQTQQMVKCAPQLQSCFKTIQKLPEVKRLIEDIQKEGSIGIAINNHPLSQQFGAFWDPDRRMIFVSPSTHNSEGQTIGSILFELQNAFVSSKINHLDSLASQGKIDKEKYVEAMERLEYHNSKNASKLAEKGIKLGIFPAAARLHTYRDFEEHYRIQKMAGHSAWIAKNYDSLAPR